VMTAALSISRLSVRFGVLSAVNDISFTVEQGSTFGIIGPNGAGKTTLLNAISGIVKCQSEDVSLGDLSLKGMRPDVRVSQGLARTFQAADFFSEMSVVNSLLLGTWRSGSRSMASSALRLPGFRACESRNLGLAVDMLERLGLSNYTKARIADVPYGSRKLIDVGRALLMRPSVLLLDEPTSGTTAQDRQELRSLMRSLRADGLSIVLVDHDVEFTTDVSDVALAMNFGRCIGIDTPKTLLEREDVRAAYIGLE
jgi:branched-chain amino acid transport system ATP-binding protein